MIFEKNEAEGIQALISMYQDSLDKNEFYRNYDDDGKIFDILWDCAVIEGNQESFTYILENLMRLMALIKLQSGSIQCDINKAIQALKRFGEVENEN